MFYSWYVYLLNLTFDVSYLKWYILLSLLPFSTLQPLSHSHWTLSKCESCLPKILCVAEAIYCQIIDACHPGSISMRKAQTFWDTCISSCKLGTSRSSYPFKKAIYRVPSPQELHILEAHFVDQAVRYLFWCPITLNLFGIGFYFAGWTIWWDSSPWKITIKHIKRTIFQRYFFHKHRTCSKSKPIIPPNKHTIHGSKVHG